MTSCHACFSLEIFNVNRALIDLKRSNTIERAFIMKEAFALN
jgi:hypothetical protein